MGGRGGGRQIGWHLYIYIYTRLRMICSEDEDLDRRLEEYGRHLTVSGWKYKTAKDRLVEGAKKDREKLLNQPRKRKDTKIACVSTYDPRVPSRTAIIKKNLHLLHANVVNKEIFPQEPSSRLTEKEKISHKCTSLLFHKDTFSMGP